MALKQYKPTTNGRRGMTSQDFSDITTRKPLKSLIKIKKSTAGRNNTGRITTRHRGGGVKQYYRLMNHQLAAGTTASIEEIEYDPNRSARIARIRDQHGLYHYILADKNMKVGNKIVSGPQAAVEVSNRLPLANIPTGTQIYNIEIQAGKGGQMVRGAGTKAQLMAKEGDYAQVKLPSGEVRRFRLECMASIGVVGNEQHQNVKIGKAGRNRRRGIRPSVRGVVMNAA
ncbi:MAG: 50S ribosomal protein L2, partial [Candidatus Saccharimonadales bacterium]